MCHQVIFKDGKVRHRGVNHGSERIVAVFCYKDVTAPGALFVKVFSLDVTNGLVDWERHTISGNNRIKYDVGVGKFAVHAIQSLHELSEMSQGL